MRVLIALAFLFSSSMSWATGTAPPPPDPEPKKETVTVHQYQHCSKCERRAFIKGAILSAIVVGGVWYFHKPRDAMSTGQDQFQFKLKTKE